jgi:hypothetical protein
METRGGLSNTEIMGKFQIPTGPGTHQFLINFTGSLDLQTFPAFWKLDVYLLVPLIARLL